MNICVFCGSAAGRDPLYAEAAAYAGTLMAERGMTLIYGGGRTGLMGIVADSALRAGGNVMGVMPRSLAEKEIQHTGLTKLEIVDTMHERKLKMADLSDGFIALPGGIGTFEEIFEQWCWMAIGIHRKPCAFLNVNGYYDSMAAMMQHAEAEGFVRPHDRAAVLFSDSMPAILDSFAAFKPPAVKWSEKP